MSKQNKIILGGGTAMTTTGTAVAFGGKTTLWAIYSAGRGASLAGICELNGFLAWCGGGSLAAGGGGMAAGSALLASLTPVGLCFAGAGVIAVGFGLYNARKNRKSNH